MYQHWHCRVCSRSQGCKVAAVCLAHLKAWAGLQETSKEASSVDVHSEGLSDDIQNGAVHFQSGCGHSLESGLVSVHRAKGRIVGFPPPCYCCSKLWEEWASASTDIRVAEFTIVMRYRYTLSSTYSYEASHWLLLIQQSANSSVLWFCYSQNKKLFRLNCPKRPE